MQNDKNKMLQQNVLFQSGRRLIFHSLVFSVIRINKTGFTEYKSSCQVHYIDIIMTTMASQITSLTVVYSTVYSDPDQRKHQNSASLAFVWGIHRDRWIPRTKGSYTEYVSIWWRHHAIFDRCPYSKALVAAAKYECDSIDTTVLSKIKIH